MVTSKQHLRPSDKNDRPFVYYILLLFLSKRSTYTKTITGSPALKKYINDEVLAQISETKNFNRISM
jgi:hypothetical protein